MPRDTDLTNVQNIQDKLAIFLNIQYGLNSYTRVSEKINGFMNDVSKNGYDIEQAYWFIANKIKQATSIDLGAANETASQETMDSINNYYLTRNGTSENKVEFDKLFSLDDMPAPADLEVEYTVDQNKQQVTKGYQTTYDYYQDVVNAIGTPDTYLNSIVSPFSEDQDKFGAFAANSDFHEDLKTKTRAMLTSNGYVATNDKDQEAYEQRVSILADKLLQSIQYRIEAQNIAPEDYMAIVEQNYELVDPTTPDSFINATLDMDVPKGEAVRIQNQLDVDVRRAEDADVIAVNSVKSDLKLSELQIRDPEFTQFTSEEEIEQWLKDRFEPAARLASEIGNKSDVAGTVQNRFARFRTMSNELSNNEQNFVRDVNFARYLVANDASEGLTELDILAADRNVLKNLISQNSELFKDKAELKEEATAEAKTLPADATFTPANEEASLSKLYSLLKNDGHNGSQAWKQISRGKTKKNAERDFSEFLGQLAVWFEARNPNKGIEAFYTRINQLASLKDKGMRNVDALRFMTEDSYAEKRIELSQNGNGWNKFWAAAGAAVSVFIPNFGNKVNNLQKDMAAGLRELAEKATFEEAPQNDADENAIEAEFEEIETADEAEEQRIKETQEELDNAYQFLADNGGFISGDDEDALAAKIEERLSPASKSESLELQVIFINVLASTTKDPLKTAQIMANLDTLEKSISELIDSLNDIKEKFAEFSASKKKTIQDGAFNLALNSNKVKPTLKSFKEKITVIYALNEATPDTITLEDCMNVVEATTTSSKKNENISKSDLEKSALYLGNNPQNSYFLVERLADKFKNILNRKNKETKNKALAEGQDNAAEKSWVRIVSSLVLGDEASSNEHDESYRSLQGMVDNNEIKGNKVGEMVAKIAKSPDQMQNIMDSYVKSKPSQAENTADAQDDVIDAGLEDNASVQQAAAFSTDGNDFGDDMFTLGGSDEPASQEDMQAMADFVNGKDGHQSDDNNANDNSDNDDGQAPASDDPKAANPVVGPVAMPTADKDPSVQPKDANNEVGGQRRKKRRGGAVLIVAAVALAGTALTAIGLDKGWWGDNTGNDAPVASSILDSDSFDTSRFGPIPEGECLEIAPETQVTPPVVDEIEEPRGLYFDTEDNMFKVDGIQMEFDGAGGLYDVIHNDIDAVGVDGEIYYHGDDIPEGTEFIMTDTIGSIAEHNGELKKIFDCADAVPNGRVTQGDVDAMCSAGSVEFNDTSFNGVDQTELNTLLDDVDVFLDNYEPETQTDLTIDTSSTIEDVEQVIIVDPVVPTPYQDTSCGPRDLCFNIFSGPNADPTKAHDYGDTGTKRVKTNAATLK